VIYTTKDVATEAKAKAAEPALPGDAASGEVVKPESVDNPDVPKIQVKKEKQKMSENTTPDPVAIERQRVKEIVALGERFGCMTEAQKAVGDGMPLQDFQNLVLTKINAIPAPADTRIGMTPKEARKWSLLSGVRRLAEGKRPDGIEREASDAMAKILGRDSRGFFIPSDILYGDNSGSDVHKRDVTTSSAVGGYTIQTTVVPPMINALVNAMVLVKAGCLVLRDLPGPITVPRLSTPNSAYWVAEGSAPTESTWTLGQLSLSPKTCGAWTELTRQVLVQSSFALEQMVRDDLMGAVARKIDLAGLYGRASTSLTEEPLGILNNTTVTKTAFGTTAVGDVANYSDIIGLQTTVHTANGFGQRPCYITNSTIRGALKVTPSSTAIAGLGFIAQTIDGQDYVDGLPLYVTNAIPNNIALPSTTLGAVASGLIFAGAMESAVLALFSGMDVMTDPYSQSSTGKVRVLVFQDVDFGLRQSGNFVRCKDVIAAAT
jgi:HK97 family phage major capsid protein